MGNIIPVFEVPVLTVRSEGKGPQWEHVQQQICQLNVQTRKGVVNISVILRTRRSRMYGVSSPRSQERMLWHVFLFTSLLNSSRSDAFKIIKLKQISADSFPVHDSVKSPLSHKSESTPLGVIRSTHLSNICKANTNNQHAAKWSISLAKRRLFLTDVARPLNQIVASIGMKCDLVARLGKQSRLLRPHTPTPLLLPSFFLFFFFSLSLWNSFQAV